MIKETVANIIWLWGVTVFVILFAIIGFLPLWVILAVVAVLT